VPGEGLVGRMRIAVPEHQGRIAPVFDTCRHVMVFLQDLHDQRLMSDEDWSAVSQKARVSRLRDLHVDVLLCGGISCWLEDQVHLQGIRLVAWLAGDLPQVLTAFREGTIMDPEYAMPGTLMCKKHRQMLRTVLRSRLHYKS
jgi:predicted Fe-Mo cluster-binding NifX family protein